MRELHTDEEITQVLREAKTIALLGAHTDPKRPSHFVAEYLRKAGYRIIPVNPALEGQTLHGETVRAKLNHIGEAVDIVDMFRHPELLEMHLDEILAMDPQPGLVWLQDGIRNDDFAQKIIGAGIPIVQSRCTKRDHGRFIAD